MRQNDVEEAAQRACPVHLGRLQLFAVQRLDRGQQDQRGKGQPLPADDTDDRSQRVMGEKVDRLKSQSRRQMSKQPVDRVHEHVLPDQRRDGGHDKERRDHQDAHDPLTPDRLVKQQRQEDPADDGNDQHTADQHQRVAYRIEERRVGQKESVVHPACETFLSRLQQVVEQERKVDGH